jgi:hypothetical protein
MPTSFTVNFHVYITDTATSAFICEGDVEILMELAGDGDICIWAGTAEDAVCGSIFDWGLYRSGTPSCGWRTGPLPTPESQSIHKAGDDPTGAWAGSITEVGGLTTITYSAIVIS